jgi:hypothetical protein
VLKRDLLLAAAQLQPLAPLTQVLDERAEQAGGGRVGGQGSRGDYSKQ